MYAQPSRLGFSFNPIDWVESAGSWLENTFEPGTGGGGGDSDAVTITSNSATNDDLTTLKIWAKQVKANGFVPTRVPSGYTFAGELCSRTQGPGTKTPNGTPIYVVAEQGIRDTDHRVQGDLADDQNGVIMSFLQSLGLDPVTTPGGPFAGGLSTTTLLVGGAVALGALFILAPRRSS